MSEWMCFSMFLCVCVSQQGTESVDKCVWEPVCEHTSLFLEPFFFFFTPRAPLSLHKYVCLSRSQPLRVCVCMTVSVCLRQSKREQEREREWVMRDGREWRDWSWGVMVVAVYGVCYVAPGLCSFPQSASAPSSPERRIRSVQLKSYVLLRVAVDPGSFRILSKKWPN